MPEKEYLTAKENQVYGSKYNNKIFNLPEKEYLSATTLNFLGKQYSPDDKCAFRAKNDKKL